MRITNNYNCGYQNNDSKLNRVKYEFLNEYGYNLDSSSIETYNEEKIIKTTHNHNLKEDIKKN